MSQINETAIKTPGVYTTEMPLFPPSVAQVATAIPAFIGYTKRATKYGKTVINQAVRISSLVQYVQYFGDAVNDLSATVTMNADNSVRSVAISPGYQMFNAMRMFFNHGGSNCYIISVGLYKADGTADILDFINAGQVRCFDVLRKEDEPTLIVVADAVMLEEPDFNSVMSEALRQCGELQDRFTILDVLHGDRERTFDNDDVITRFRNGIGSNLNYGAAYYPWLRSNLPYRINYAHTHLPNPGGGAPTPTLSSVVGANAFLTQLDRSVADQVTISNFLTASVFPEMGILINSADLDARIATVNDMITDFLTVGPTITDTVPATTNGATIQSKFTLYSQPGTGTSFSPLELLMRELKRIRTNYPAALPTLSADTIDFGASYNIAVDPAPLIYGDPVPTVETIGIQNIRARMNALHANVVNHINAFVSDVQSLVDGIEQSLISSSSIYANIKTAIKREGVIVPPSGAMAGVYAAVDGTRGVWKSPANLALNTVIEPMVNIDNNTQDDLNVDVNAGKSINAIRTFSGKGTIVWGARTLAGNDNEWRYVSVRRFFIMVEESAKKATEPFVFEPNDANTWVKVRGMLENYLTVLWRQGALAGAKPEHAFFVKCGLGQTMTSDDITNGRLIIEIGMAAVRPAEFIILRFSHKLQES